MAYVPDDRMRRKREVSRSAWDVYEALCSFADSDTGIVEPYHFSYAKLVEWSGVALGTARNAMIELRKKGWKMEDGQGRIHLAGVFVIEAKRLAKERKKAAASPEQPSLLDDTTSLVNDAASLASDVTSPASDTASLVNDASIDKDRARGFTNPDQPSTSPKTNTHTPTPDGPVAETAPPDGGGVCVAGLKFEDYLGYAQGEPGFTNPRAWAMVHYPKRDADPLVAEWKGRHELIVEGKRPVEQQLTPFHVAAQAVASVAQVPKYDVAGFIEQMQGVSQETRAKLRERFLQPEQARAHSPP